MTNQDDLVALQAHAEALKGSPDPVIDPAHPPQPPKWLTGIYLGLEKYQNIRCPALAIFADPHALGDPDQYGKDPKAAAKAEAADKEIVESQARAFEKMVPNSRVVRVPHASHYIFQSNEPEVVNAVLEFLSQLPRPSLSPTK